jgi:F-box/leucine-rich repeat protein 2/20
VDCEIILKRYITPETVFQTLFRAHFNKWLHLKLTCMEYINNLNLGFYFDVEHIHHLSVEIFNFQRKTLAAFKHLEKVITHLNLGGSLAEDAEFTELIHQCPKLIGIGFKESDSFSEKFLEVSQTIYDLDLSKCAWLNAEYLQRFARAYPKLKSIDLSNNYDLAYDDWASLHEFKSLESVDISRCHQVKNDDFTIIFHSCRNIKKFSMVECLQVNDDLFSEIGKMMTVLTDLNISKCNISDTALVELSTRCNDLYFLNLSRCPNLSERGIMEAIRHLASLYELNVTNCRISENAIDNFKKLRPMLKIID